jgi:hypothetical protein
MATLTEDEKAQVRQFIQKKANKEGVPISWIKDNLNAASQAFEDELNSCKPDLAAAIETAAPGVFDGPEKKWIGAMVLYINYVKDVI